MADVAPTIRLRYIRLPLANRQERDSRGFKDLSCHTVRHVWVALGCWFEPAEKTNMDAIWMLENVSEVVREQVPEPRS